VRGRTRKKIELSDDARTALHARTSFTLNNSQRLSFVRQAHHQLHSRRVYACKSDEIRWRREHGSKKIEIETITVSYAIKVPKALASSPCSVLADTNDPFNVHA